MKLTLRVLKSDDVFLNKMADLLQKSSDVPMTANELTHVLLHRSNDDAQTAHRRANIFLSTSAQTEQIKSL